MKKVAGVLLVLLGGVGTLFLLLMTAVQAGEWFTYGIGRTELRMLLILLAVLAVLIGLTVWGSCLLAGKPGRSGGREDGFEQNGGQQSGFEQNGRQQSGFEQNGPGQGSLPQHSYTSSLLLQIAELLKKFFLSAAILALFAMCLGAELDLSLGTMILLCVVPAGAFALYWAFWHCHTRVQAGAAGVAFYRGRKQYAAFPLDTAFSPVVTKKTVNGIFYGTDRGLRLPYKKNRFKTIPCRCITGKDFSELVEEINLLREGGAPAAGGVGEGEIPAAFRPEAFGAEGLRAGEDGWNQDFHLYREQLLAKERLQTRKTTIIVSIILAGTALVCTAFTAREPSRLPMLFSFLIPLYVLLAGILFWRTWGRYLASSRKMPERILLGGSGIRVDESLFPAAQLQEISMTPPGYTATRNGYSDRRRMTFLTSAGKTQYQLGSTPAYAGLVYEDYEKLLTAARDWCGGHGVKFREETE